MLLLPQMSLSSIG
ncbi:hypothetical protein LINPERPRIM_LOCUS24542 [Linum perenne]